MGLPILFRGGPSAPSVRRRRQDVEGDAADLARFPGAARVLKALEVHEVSRVEASASRHATKSAMDTKRNTTIR